MDNWQDFLATAEEFRLPETQLNSVKDFYSQIDRHFFEEKKAQLFGDFPVEEIEKTYLGGEHRKFNYILIASCWHILQILYRQKGYPQSMLDDIRNDLRLWGDKAMEDFGYAGLDWRIFFWCRCVLSGQILQLGRLQCDIPHKFNGPFSVVGKDGGIQMIPSRNPEPAALLNFGDWVINLHIPAAGPLKRKDCIDSIRKIVKFCEEYRPDYPFRAVVCYSWVLDPVFAKLNPKSNLKDFQTLGHAFELPGIDETNEVIWRVFGLKGQKCGIHAVPHETSMQRTVAKYLDDGGKFREFGFFILRDELPVLFT